MLDFKSARDLDREIVMAVAYGRWCQLLLIFFYSVVTIQTYGVSTKNTEMKRTFFTGDF